MAEVATELLTTSEAAAVLGLGPGMVRVLADAGRLPTQRTAKGLRLFRRADVVALREARAKARTDAGAAKGKARTRRAS